MKIQTKLLVNFFAISALIIVAYVLISLNAFQSGLENELRNRGAKGVELVLNRFQFFQEHARLGADMSIRDPDLLRAFKNGRARPVFRKLDAFMSETGVDRIELASGDGRRARRPGAAELERPENLFYLGELPPSGKPAGIREIEDEFYLVARADDGDGEKAGRKIVSSMAGYMLDDAFMDRLKKDTGFDIVLYKNESSVRSTLMGAGDRRLADRRLDPDLFTQLDSMNARGVRGVYVLKEEEFFGRSYQVAFAPLFPGDTFLDHYFLMIAFPIDYVKAAYGEYLWKALGIAAVGLLIVTLFSYILARSISRPIAKLSERMQTLRTQEFSSGTSTDTRAPSGEDGGYKQEIRILEESFDAMVGAVRDSRRTIQQYAEGLEVKVQERTQELVDKMDELESSSRALQAEIEERRRTERELMLARDKAEVADRAKSQFLAIMSHEIRTPMNSILGMADLLSETELDPEQRRYIEIFKGSGDALVKIINDILDISRVDLGEMQLDETPFDPYELIHELYLLLTDRFEAAGIRFAQEIAANVPRRLIGDPSRLRQILLNLLDNSLKFSEKGQIKISLVRTDTPETFRRDVCPLRFSVEDQGIGIPPEKIDAIFEHFTQADSSTTREHGGTGLGLTIVKRLVEMMGGEVNVSSLPGQGSRFDFSLSLKPAAFDEPQGLRSGPPLRREITAGKVLLVEDNEDNVLLVELFLKKTDVQLEIARNGQEALDLIEAGSRYDLILMDIQMPIMDGFTATRKIREHERAGSLEPAPIVALTAYALKEEIQRCYDAGCDKHFVKPIKKQDLLELIREAASGAGAKEQGTI